MPEYGFGLDIGAYSTKFACLKKVKKETQLVGFAIQRGSEPTSIKNDIDKILQENKVKEAEMVTSVAGPSVVVRYSEFPDMSENEVRGAIELESERFLPFRLEDVNLDLQILKGAHEVKGKMVAMIVAARKEIIKKRLDFLEAGGWSPLAIDVDALSIANCFEYEGAAATNAVALINLGAAFTNLCIVEEGLSCFTRDIPLGGNNITSHIQKRLGVPLEEAEDLKVKIGLGSEAEGIDKDKIIKVNDAIKEILETFLKEIRYSFDFHQSQSKGKAVEKIYASGGTSLVKEIDKFLSAELGSPVEIWNPLRVLSSSNPEVINKWQPTAPLFAVSLGLAYKGLEL